MAAADDAIAASGDAPAIAAVGKRIMVGLDGSASAWRALDRAADLAGYGSNVAVIAVSPPDGNGSCSGLLSQAKERLEARLVPAYILNPVGDPADELVKAAAALEADVLVIGTCSHERVGSIAEELLVRAPCDVLVVR